MGMGAPGGGPTEGQPGGAGGPAALASAMTLRLRFRSSEGPLGRKGLLFSSASGARAWGLGGAPRNTPSTHWYQALAPRPPPGLPGGSLGAGSLAAQRRSLTHAPLHWVPGWGPSAWPWSWALEAAAVTGGGHSSARRPPPRPHRPSLGCGMGVLWVSPPASFQRAGRPGGMRAMSAHQALGPLMWARVTAAAGWAWSPPPPGPADPPEPGWGSQISVPPTPVGVTCTQGVRRVGGSGPAVSGILRRGCAPMASCWRF